MIDMVDNFLKKMIDKVFNTKKQCYMVYAIDTLNENADKDNDFQLIYII